MAADRIAVPFGGDHLAFAEVLARTPVSDPVWGRTLAGLLTLRAVDRWHASFAAAELRPDAWNHPSRNCSYRGVRRAIASVEASSPIPAILSGMIELLAAGRAATPHTVSEILLQYSRALELDAAWSLAIDTYGTSFLIADEAGEWRSAVHAALRMGYCHRVLSRLGEATSWYARAEWIATAHGETGLYLQARVGLANVAKMRGNFADARTMLTDVVQGAEATGNRFARATALHELSEIAYRVGEYDAAIQMVYEALAEYERQADRDRAIHDLAVNFLALDLVDAAHDAYLILLATAQAQETQWTAVMNLLETAARQGDRLAVERYRRELADVNLPPPLAFAFVSQLGIAYGYLGETELAREELTRALQLAETHQLHGEVFATERRLQDLAAASRTTAGAKHPPSSATMEVAQTLRGLRQTVCGH